MIIRVLTNLLKAYSYNRSDEEMFSLYDELIKRFDRDMSVEWSDDGNIIYSTLVLMFGDYGTSPRSGWFTNGLNEECSKYLAWSKTHENTCNPIE